MTAFYGANIIEKLQLPMQVIYVELPAINAQCGSMTIWLNTIIMPIEQDVTKLCKNKRL